MWFLLCCEMTWQTLYNMRHIDPRTIAEDTVHSTDIQQFRKGEIQIPSVVYLFYVPERDIMHFTDSP